MGVAVMFVYDVTRRSTLDDITFWYNQMNEYIKAHPAKFAHCNPLKSAILIANKGDVPPENGRVISTEEGMAVANQLNIPYYCETSALYDANVVEAFNSVILLARDALRMPHRATGVNNAGQRADVRQIATAIQPMRRSGPRRGKGLFLAIAASLLPDRPEEMGSGAQGEESGSAFLATGSAPSGLDISHYARLFYFAFAFCSIIALWIPWFILWNGEGETPLRKLGQFTNWVTILSLVYFGQLCYVLLLVGRMKHLPEVTTVQQGADPAIQVQPPGSSSRRRDSDSVHRDSLSLSRSNSSSTRESRFSLSMKLPTHTEITPYVEFKTELAQPQVGSTTSSVMYAPVIAEVPNSSVASAPSDAQPARPPSIFDTEIQYPPPVLEPLFTENETTETNRLMNRIVILLRRITRLFSITYTITATWMIIFFAFILPESEYFKSKTHKLNADCKYFPQLCNDPWNLAVEVLLSVLPPAYLIGQVFVLPAASSFDPSLQDLGISVLLMTIYIFQSWVVFAILDFWPHFRQRVVYDSFDKNAGVATVIQLVVIIPVQIVLFFVTRLLIQWLRRYQTWRAARKHQKLLERAANANDAHPEIANSTGLDDGKSGYVPPSVQNSQNRAHQTQAVTATPMIAMATLAGHRSSQGRSSQHHPHSQDTGTQSSSTTECAKDSYNSLQQPRLRAESFSSESGLLATSVTLANHVAVSKPVLDPNQIVSLPTSDDSSGSMLDQLIGVGYHQSTLDDTYEY